jgi:hypothetical protein
MIRITKLASRCQQIQAANMQYSRELVHLSALQRGQHAQLQMNQTPRSLSDGESTSTTTG